MTPEEQAIGFGGDFTTPGPYPYDYKLMLNQYLESVHSLDSSKIVCKSWTPPEMIHYSDRYYWLPLASWTFDVTINIKNVQGIYQIYDGFTSYRILIRGGKVVLFRELDSI